MTKKKKKQGKFILRLEYGRGRNIGEQVDEAVNSLKDVNVVGRGWGPAGASTELGRFISKSEARRIGAMLKGKLDKDAEVTLKIRESR